MLIGDLLSPIASHMIEGMMVHEQLMNSYNFLGLYGYGACHEYHYLSETIGYTKFCKYVSEHFDIIVPSEIRPNDPKILPESWRDMARFDVTSKDRREAIIAGYEAWIKWEVDTLDLYEKCYEGAIESGRIPFSEFIKSYILDVEEELTYVKREQILKEAMNYDIVSIIEEQDKVYKFFKKKIRRIGDERYENE